MLDSTHDLVEYYIYFDFFVLEDEVECECFFCHCFRNNLRKHANECPADIKDIEKLEQAIEELPCTILNLEFIVKVWTCVFFMLGKLPEIKV